MHRNARPASPPPPLSCLLLGSLLLGCTPPAPPPRRQTPALAASASASASASDGEPSPAVMAVSAEPSAVATPPLPAASATPPERYDLQADLARRRAEAMRDLGPRAQTEVVEGVFVLAAPPGFDLRGTGGLVSRTLAAYFHERFDKRPAKALTVFLFPSADPYGAYCQKRFHEACLSPFGFFHPEPRFIVMNAGPGLGTLTHELVHPIIESDFPTAPTWLDEGIASLFEAPVMPQAGEIHGVKNWRHPRLIAALGSAKEKSKVSLPALFGMSDAFFRGDDESLNYVIARTFCLWLDNRGQLFPFYRAFRDGVANDPTGEKAFVAITRQTPAEANAEFLRFARGL
jgi:hypothetical protein